MMSKVFWSLAAASTLALGLSTAAMADAGKAIEAREACMKGHAAMMKVMVPIIKGEAAYDKAAIDEAIAKSDAGCAGWADWWGEDTKPGGAVKTEAKLEIWTDPKGFEEAGMNFVKAQEAVKASTDEASFKAAFPALGEACKACHEKFREAD